MIVPIAFPEIVRPTFYRLRAALRNTNGPICQSPELHDKRFEDYLEHYLTERKT